MRQLDSDLHAAKKLRLPWWGVLCWMAACALFVWLLDHFGKFDLARPVLYSIGMLAVTVAIKRKLRCHVWFWGTVIIFVLLHLLLILFVPWTSNWIPAVVVIPFAIVDLYAMLAVVALVGRFFERNSASEI